MGRFSDLLDEFDSMLEVIDTKKSNLDKASEDVIAAQQVLQQASADYNEAVLKATDLRVNINRSLGDVLPNLQEERFRASK